MGNHQVKNKLVKAIPDSQLIWMKIRDIRANAKRRNMAIEAQGETLETKEDASSYEETIKIQKQQLMAQADKLQKQEEIIQKMDMAYKALDDRANFVDFTLLSAEVMRDVPRVCTSKEEDKAWGEFRDARNQVAHGEYSPTLLGHPPEVAISNMMSKDLPMVQPRFVRMMADEFAVFKFITEDVRSNIAERFKEK